MNESIFYPLEIPKAPLKLKRIEGEVHVWDIPRKKWLLLTPEEWVRQHIFHHLKEKYGIPVSLINSEFAVKINTTLLRIDLLVRNENAQPLLIVECKAPQIKIDDKVAHQVANYNYTLGAKFLLLTNGLKTIILQINTEGKWNEIEELPHWQKLKIQ